MIPADCLRWAVIGAEAAGGTAFARFGRQPYPTRFFVGPVSRYRHRFREVIGIIFLQYLFAKTGQLAAV